MVPDPDQPNLLRGRSDIFCYAPNAGDSMLRHMRQYCGGNLYSVDKGIDPSASAITQHLQRLINRYEEDIVALINNPNPYRGVWSMSIAGDPESVTLLELLLAEERATPLYEALAASPGERGMRGCLVTTPQSGRSLQEASIPRGLLQACVSHSLIHGQVPTAAAMREHAPAAIESFLDLTSGERTEVPAAVGAVGSRLETASQGGRGAASPPDRIRVGDGYVRQTTELDHHLFTTTLGQLGLVWVTHDFTQAKFFPDSSDPSNLPDEAFTFDGTDKRAQPTLQERWDAVAQAVVLSATIFPPPAWTASAFNVASPLTPSEHSPHTGGVSQWQSQLRSTSSADFGDVERWHQLISQTPAALEVSRRRVVSALASRSDPLDALVDAVVAWESIFSGAPETQMRTVLPSCKLLSTEDDSAKLLTSMKRVYRMRSDLVHGKQSKASQNDVLEARDDALRWVLRLLQLIYSEMPHLLNLNAAQRSDLILVPGSHFAERQ
ncbi:hypothetical protein AA0Y32_07440 [Georgenia phoenicis]|uniref:hypothetical protein n=1 Tax=unclassified Georgenia TaxID=2626815 RepID=UPI0039AFB5EF